MDIKSNLFAPTAPTTQPNGNASEARRAFEAMLTASAARTRSTQAPLGVQPVAVQPRPTQDGTLATPMRASPRAQIEPSIAHQDAPSRPGRVLDIKV